MVRASMGSRERSYKKTHNTQLLEHKAEENCSEAPGAVTSMESANERVAMAVRSVQYFRLVATAVITQGEGGLGDHRSPAVRGDPVLIY